METSSIKHPTSFNWVKNLYFYVILAGSILALAISSFVLIYSSAIRFVFTDLQTKPYITYEECKNNTNYYDNSTPVAIDTKPVDSSTTRSQPELTADEKKACADKKINTEYQQTLLSTSLAILVAGIILTIHLIIFRNRKEK